MDSFFFSIVSFLVWVWVEVEAVAADALKSQLRRRRWLGVVGFLVISHTTHNLFLVGMHLLLFKNFRSDSVKIAFLLKQMTFRWKTKLCVPLIVKNFIQACFAFGKISLSLFSLHHIFDSSFADENEKNNGRIFIVIIIVRLGYNKTST
jgi:hypothetical protein